MSSKIYKDTAETPLRVLRVVLCQYVIEDLRRHRRNSPPSSSRRAVSICHRRSTKTPPKLPSEFFVSCCVNMSSKIYEDTAETPLRVLRVVLCQYVIEDLRRHRRNSPPSSLFSFLCVSSKTHEKTEDRPAIFRTDLFFCSLMSSTSYTRTDRRFSGPTFFPTVLCHQRVTQGPTADFPDRPFFLWT